MASNSVQYIFDIIDRYTPTIKRMQMATQKLNQRLKATKERLSRATEKLGKFGRKAVQVGKNLSLRLSLPLVAASVFMIKAASDAEETGSKFDTVFKDVSERAKKVADDLRTNYGMSRIESQKLLSNTGDLLAGFKFSGEAALDMSEKVNKLAADLASFNNLPTAQASNAITKALLGEREAIKTLGISILEEDVKRKVQILRAKGMRFESMRQAKAIATLMLATEQSTNAIGDFNRTSRSFANRMKIMKARISDAAVTLGNIMLPAATKLVNITIKMINKFEKLSPATKKIIVVVGALAAALPPLLIVLGAVSVAIGAISAPVVLVAGGIAALIAVIGLLVANWSRVKEVMIGDPFIFIKASIAKFMGMITKLRESYLKMVNLIKNNPLSRGLGKISGAVKGVFGGGEENTVGGAIDVNINAPKGIVQQVMTRAKGKNFALGTNMRES